MISRAKCEEESLNPMASISLSVSNFITLRLTQGNDHLWREKIVALAERQDTILQICHPSPQFDVPTNDTSKDFSQTCLQWHKSDRQLCV